MAQRYIVDPNNPNGILFANGEIALVSAPERSRDHIVSMMNEWAAEREKLSKESA